MGNEHRQLAQQSATAVADRRQQIVETLARREVTRVHAALAQRFDQAVRARLRRGAPIARHVVDVRAALAQRVAEQLATAVAAEHDRALALHVLQSRQRQQSFAVEARPRARARRSRRPQRAPRPCPGRARTAASEAGQRAGSPARRIRRRWPTRIPRYRMTRRFACTRASGARSAGGRITIAGNTIGVAPSAASCCARPAAWRAGRVTSTPAPASGPGAARRGSSE